MHDQIFAAIARLAYEHPTLDKLQKAVLIALGRFVNSERRDAYPSTATLASMTSLSPSSVQKALRGLERAGILRNEGQRKTPRGLGTNLYVLLCPLDIDHEGGAVAHYQSHTGIFKSKIRKGISVVSQTTPLRISGKPAEPGSSWIADTSRELCFVLADALIVAEKKDQRYRSDAESDEWIYRMESFVSETLGQIGALTGRSDKEEFRAIYEEAMRISAAKLDFRICSGTYVAPRLLHQAPERGILVQAVRKVVGDQDPHVSVRERPPLGELTDAEREANRATASELMRESMKKHVVEEPQGQKRLRHGSH